jgi:ribosomal-protein-alanine N-acetyltransferase
MLAFGIKGWPVADFERYLNDKTILICGTETCFAVFRLIGSEAEILTVSSHPDVQGRGGATAMFRDALDKLNSLNIQEIFLEVADNNTAALALYTRAGFLKFNTRRNYYTNGVSAICMKAVLSPRLSA